MATKKTFEPRIAPAMPGDPEGCEAVEMEPGGGACRGCAFEPAPVGGKNCPRSARGGLACLRGVRCVPFDCVWRRKPALYGNEED